MSKEEHTMGLEIDLSKIDEAVYGEKKEEIVEEVLEEVVDLSKGKFFDEFFLMKVTFPSKSIGCRSVSRGRMLQIREKYEEFGEDAIDKYLDQFEIAFLTEILRTKADKIEKDLIGEDEGKILGAVRAQFERCLNRNVYRFDLGSAYLWIVDPDIRDQLYAPASPETIRKYWEIKHNIDKHIDVKTAISEFIEDLYASREIISIRDINAIYSLIQALTIAKNGKEWYGFQVRTYTNKIAAGICELPFNRSSLAASNDFSKKLYLVIQSQVIQKAIAKIMKDDEAEELDEDKRKAIKRVLKKAHELNRLGLPEVEELIQEVLRQLEINKTIGNFKTFLSKKAEEVDERLSGIEIDPRTIDLSLVEEPEGDA